VVAHFEIAKIRKKGLGDRAMTVAAPLYLGALFFEDIRLSDDLELRGWEPEALRKLADCDEDRHIEQLVRAIHEDAAKVVFRQELDGPLCPSFGGSHEQDRVASFPCAPNLCDPFLDLAPKLHGRLAGDVDCVAIAYRQLLEFRRAFEPRRQVFPLQ